MLCIRAQETGKHENTVQYTVETILTLQHFTEIARLKPEYNWNINVDCYQQLSLLVLRTAVSIHHMFTVADWISEYDNTLCIPGTAVSLSSLGATTSNPASLHFQTNVISSITFEQLNIFQTRSAYVIDKLIEVYIYTYISIF